MSTDEIKNMDSELPKAANTYEIKIWIVSNPPTFQPYNLKTF